MSKETARIDKYLWSVRLFKTRSKASDACKQKKILIGEFPVKPSRTIQADEIIKIKHPPAYRLYKVKQVLSNRVGAKLVCDYLEEITPGEIIETLDIANKDIIPKREKGTGRPTKKDRRDLKRFFD